MKLTRHFIRNWEKRVGGTPTARQVEQIVKHGVRVQPCRLLYEKYGVPFRTLGIYWDPERNVIVKIDNYHGTAVSVLTPKARIEEQL